MTEKKNDHLADLRKRVATAPVDPGVYRWLNKKGDVLYVGKAKNLRNRLKSYVSGETKQGPWKLSLQQQITDFDVTVTNSELEALMLETNLIKENKPKYNVLMKDDKNYVYVEITIKDAYPVVSVVRRMANDKAKYFGPYTKKFEVDRVLDMLHLIFPYKACPASLATLNRDPSQNLEGAKPCLEFHIGQCCGLCTGAISQDEYRKRIDDVIGFLKGDRIHAVQVLKERMQTAATEKKFELAAKLRDALVAIEHMEEHEAQLASDASREDADAIGAALLNGHAQVVVLNRRNGRIINEQSLALAGEAETITEVLAQFVPQYYEAAADIPALVLLGEELEEQEVFSQLLSQKRGTKVEVRVPERGRKSHLLDLAIKNAEQKVKQQEAKWESAERNTKEALSDLKELLNLPDLPKRIEGYDISHLGGTETVGSMVVMQNGKANNKDYRSFTIRTLKEGDIDDYKSLKEVLRRRLLHLVRNIKQEEAQWKKEGITFGKARKGEQKVIEEIIAEHKEELGQNEFTYKDFLVARNEKDIVSFGRLTTHKDGTVELQSIWVHKDYRGKSLGKFIARRILEKIKKGKVYILINEKLEEYYASLGFRHVHTAPAILEKELASDTHPSSCSLVMVYDSSQNKKDSSLSSRPDLLVIDGGKGQLSSVVEVLKDLKLDIPVIGLAKREEDVFVPGQKAPVLFPKDAQAKFLLMRLRNEAHRFANKHREKRLTSAAIASELDAVPGIGEVAKKELLNKFGTVKRIRSASDEELRQVVSAAQLLALRHSLGDAESL